MPEMMTVGNSGWITHDGPDSAAAATPYKNGTVRYPRGRENGPATINSCGDLYWKVRMRSVGVVHREEGPAFYGADGQVTYYLSGRGVSYEKFLRKVQGLV